VFLRPHAESISGRQNCIASLLKRIRRSRQLAGREQGKGLRRRPEAAAAAAMDVLEEEGRYYRRHGCARGGTTVARRFRHATEEEGRELIRGAASLGHAELRFAAARRLHAQIEVWPSTGRGTSSSTTASVGATAPPPLRSLRTPRALRLHGRREEHCRRTSATVVLLLLHLRWSSYSQPRSGGAARFPPPPPTPSVTPNPPPPWACSAAGEEKGGPEHERGRGRGGTRGWRRGLLCRRRRGEGGGAEEILPRILGDDQFCLFDLSTVGDANEGMRPPVCCRLLLELVSRWLSSGRNGSL
jgi:hypothetical protein